MIENWHFTFPDIAQILQLKFNHQRSLIKDFLESLPALKLRQAGVSKIVVYGHRAIDNPGRELRIPVVGIYAIGIRGYVFIHNTNSMKIPVPEKSGIPDILLALCLNCD